MKRPNANQQVREEADRKALVRATALLTRTPEPQDVLLESKTALTLTPETLEENTPLAKRAESSRLAGGNVIAADLATPAESAPLGTPYTLNPNWSALHPVP